MTSDNKVTIVGTGSGSELAFYYLQRDNFIVEAFTVELQNFNKHLFCGVPVIPLEELDVYQKNLFLPSFSNKFRHNKYEELTEMGANFISYISPFSNVFGLIGDNCFIMENVVIQPNTTIGSNTIIMSNSVIGNKAKIGQGCFLGNHVLIGEKTELSDNCEIEDYCCIDKNTYVANNITVLSGTHIRKDLNIPGEIYPRKK